MQPTIKIFAIAATLYCMKRIFSNKRESRKELPFYAPPKKNFDFEENQRMITSKVHESAQKKIEEISSSSVRDGIESRGVSVADPLDRSKIPFHLHTVIYDFLDENSKASYKRTCRYFNQAFTHFEPLFSKVEAFIKENYEIIAGNSNKKSIKQFFFSPFIVGCGENHTQPGHVLLNSIICNLLFRTNTHYFMEGGESSVNYWKERGLYMFKHLRPEIAASGVKSWDLDSATDEDVRWIENRILEYAASDIFRIQTFLRLFLDKKQWTFERFCSFLDKKFEKLHLESFWSSLCLEINISSPEILKETLVEVIEISILHKEWTMMILKFQTLDLIIKSMNRPKFQKVCDQLDQLRDIQLQQLTSITFNSRANAFFLAGSNHIVKLYQKYNKSSSLNRPLCLIPLDTISEYSVEESYKRIFLQDALPVSSAISTTMTKEESNSEVQMEKRISVQSLKESDHSLSLQAQIERLLAFNFRDLGYDKNHYGLWTSRATQIIILEIERTTKEIILLSREIEIYSDDINRRGRTVS